jgi:L-lactate dehydrogenase complex protein LldG
MVAGAEMTGAREEVLRRIRGALADVPGTELPENVEVPRDYRRVSSDARAVLVERFAERVADYRAQVRRVVDVGDAVSETCRSHGVRRAVVPAALPDEWRPSDDVAVVEDRGLSAAELDAVDVAVTGCAVAIAETGTIALDGRATCGRRAVTLVPDHHICIVRDEQIVGSVPEGLALLAHAVERDRAPVTLISGPSASSDIELSRVEGVHGPRHLVVLIVG